MVQRRRLLQGGLGFGAGLALAGCGGGTAAGGDTRLRLLNAAGLGALDLYADEDRRAANVAVDALSGYADVDEGRQTLRLRRAGAGTSSWSLERSLDEDSAYTVVGYATQGVLKGWLLEDEVEQPDSGSARLRVLNLAPEAGPLDVFVTEADVPLGAVSPEFAGVAVETASGLAEIDAGSYRVRVTAAGSRTDLRLDVPSLALGSRRVVTLVLSAARGGVLVDGHALVQGGGVSVARNTAARVRVVAGTTGAGIVALSIGGTTVAGALRSPSVGGYVLVPAGAQTPVVAVNGTAVAAPALTLAPGGEATLLVLGDPAAPQIVAVDDDNRPAATSGQARLRLVHGVNGVAGSLSMTLDFATLASDVAFGTASGYTGTPAGSDLRLQVAAGATVVYANDDLTLVAGGVYSVVLLGEAGAPFAVLQRDR